MRRARTSAKEGSLFFLLCVQSSTCFSSIVGDERCWVVTGGRRRSAADGERGRETTTHFNVVAGKLRTPRPLATTTYSKDVDVGKSSLSCRARNKDSLLPDFTSLSRNAVRHAFHNQHMSMSLTDAPASRSFIQSAYPTIKRHNPDLPVLIREANGVPARIFARFGTFPHKSRSFLGSSATLENREGCRTTYRGGQSFSCRDHYQVLKVAQPVTSTHNTYSLNGKQTATGYNAMILHSE